MLFSLCKAGLVDGGEAFILGENLQDVRLEGALILALMLRGRLESPRGPLNQLIHLGLGFLIHLFDLRCKLTLSI